MTWDSFEDEGPCMHHRSQFDTLPCPPATTLRFAGGAAEIRKPTREELVLSAQQWSKAIADHLVDWNAFDSRARGMLERLDAVLAELAAP